MSARASFWHTTLADYTAKFAPIVNLDLSKNYVLCFGTDDCCKANLNFLASNLKARGYTKSLRVQIVDELSLDTLDEYTIEL